MTVIKIEEDNHGFIGVAANYPAVIDFLVNNYWLEDSTEVWVREDDYRRLDEVISGDWVEKMKNWGIENFNDYWDGSFYLTEVEVYGSEV